MSQTDEDVANIPTDSEFGDEGDEEEIEEEEEEEEDVLTVYDSDTFISGPTLSKHSTIPEEIMEFDFLYGSESRKHFNLTSPDPDTLLWAAGNFIVVFDVPTQEVRFRRSALGGGIGHIKANPMPDFNQIAIAENGDIPLIIIYEWPSMDINCVLKGGAEKIYSHLDYSPDGLLLVSQSGEPDYLITIFNWPKRRILLRTKSYVNDVYRVKFSPYVPGQLTTCGVSHIKFWKMANTFTGLKLKGDIGRFGKTEFSDIFGVLPMPDEKVVSGCSWGNILIWDAGLIKLEVFRSMRRKCHEAPIVQIYYTEGELMTISMDGHVKIWGYEKIDQADPPDEDRIIQIEPLYDFYTPGVMLMCIRKQFPDEKDSHFFAQDGNGGIWIIDLNTEVDPEKSQQLYRCHGGPVVAIRSCSWAPYFVTLGTDGRLIVYAYTKRKMIHTHRFPAGGTCMLWIAPLIADHGDELVMGFADGALRLCILAINEEEETAEVLVTQVVKAHDKAVTQIAINRNYKILVSGGEDCNIFVFQILIAYENVVSLQPIGYIPVPNVVTCLEWHFKNENEVIVGCLQGEIVQVRVPGVPQEYTGVSYLLKDLHRKDNMFKTYKAQIRRDIKIREIEARKAAKVEVKREKMAQLKKDNPHLEIDEEIFLEDSESEEELEPLFIPEIPNRILWMQSTQEDTIWLSMAGYDAGYIYEYKIDQKDQVPYFFRMVDDADDIEINSYIYNFNQTYLIFAMQHGQIRINKLKDRNHRDLSDYWILSMHNNQNGFVPNLAFSNDEKYFFSCGHDGNVFVLKFNPENEEYIPETILPYVTVREKFPVPVEDEPQFSKLSLEQASLKREQDRIDRVANKNKEILRGKLKKLNTRFFRLLKRNQQLKPSQIIPQEELEVDERVTGYIDGKFEEELELVKRKVAFDVQKSYVKMMKLKSHLVDSMTCFPIIVKGLNSECFVKMLRQRKLDPKHEEIMEILELKIKETELRSRPIERAPLVIKQAAHRKKKEKGLEYFLISLSPSVIEMRLGPKLTRLLQKYRDRKLKWEKRNDEWDQFMAKKPPPEVNHPDDEVALKCAQDTIGDYKLKSSKHYQVSREERVSTVKKYKQLLLSREEQFQIREAFNNKVFQLRDEKVQLRLQLEQMRQRVEEIHQEIPEELRKDAPVIQEQDEAITFPEKRFSINVTLVIEEDELLQYNFIEDRQEELIFINTGIFFKTDKYEKDALPERSPNVKKPPPKDYGDIAELQYGELFKFSENDRIDTPWELEVRERRYRRKIYEQDAVIRAINKKIDDFNKKLINLANERYKVEVDAKIMDLHVMTVHQELLIIKEFEQLEDELQEKVNIKIMELGDVTDFMNEIQEEIGEHEEEINKCNNEIKLIQARFIQTVMDNKFFEFLKKVFKKKYRPPKVHTDDDSSSESSSSSSSSEEEEDAKSIDSRDFGIIKQDLNVCPKGCDPGIYEYTVNSRSNRHQVELKIKDEQKMIEQLKKDWDMQAKKVKIVEKSKQICEEELQKFQNEKQQRLNEVRATIFMKLSQLQHITQDGQRSDIMDTLVFSSARLSKLYKRVDELYVETEHQKTLHKKDLKHLTRMNTDCDFMRQTIKNLKGRIRECMMIKFGKPVDINEIEEGMIKRTFGKDDISDLEEVLLKKLVHDLRLSLMDIKGMYIPELNHWSNMIRQTQTELATTLKNNTYRRELLTMLGREKISLAEELTLQEKKKAHLTGIENFEDQFLAEITRLENIMEDQKQQIEDLKEEIKMLKTKGLPPKPIKRDIDDEFRQMEMMLEDDDDFLHKPFSSELLIPLSEEARAAASEVVHELLSNLQITLNKRSSENFIKSTLMSIMKRVSVTEMVEELVKNLPVDYGDKLSYIEDAAEKLVDVPSRVLTFSDEDITRFSKELLEDIVDDILLDREGPQAMLIRLVERLVNSLPIEFLLRKESIELLVWRLVKTNIRIEIDKKELELIVTQDNMKRLLNEIIETVFAIGLDIIYYRADIDDY